MSIVLFGGEKGGTGKTTLATNMAAMLALQGKDVLLLDTDRQGTASFGATVREDTKIEPRIACVQKIGKGLASQVRDMAVPSHGCDRQSESNWPNIKYLDP